MDGTTSSASMNCADGKYETLRYERIVLVDLGLNLLVVKCIRLFISCTCSDRIKRLLFSSKGCLY